MGVLSNNDVCRSLICPPETPPNLLVRLLVQPSVWGILLLATALRFYGATTSAIWCDEGSSLMLSAYSFAGIWAHAAHDVHPPLYFLVLHGWIALFGDGLLSIRTLSVLPGIATVLLGLWLVRLIATRRAALLAGVMLALLPIGVRYSQEVRMYSLLGMWLIAATVALVYWVKAPHKKRYLVVYTLLMTAAFYTHYFTAFCVIVHWSYLLMSRQGAGMLIKQPAWWIANASIVVLFLPWVPGFIDLLQHMDELKTGGDVAWEPPVDARSLPAMFWQILIQDEGEHLPWPLFWLAPLIFLEGAVWTALRDPTPYKFHALVVIYTVLPIVMIYALSFVTPLFIERYVMFAALGLPMIIAIAVDRLLKGWRILAVTLLVLFVGAQCVGLRNTLTGTPDRFNHLVKHVNQQFLPGDRIVISDLFWYFGYVYYNKTGAQPMLYTPLTAEGTSGRPGNYGFGTLVNSEGEKIYLDRLEDLSTSVKRVWLISSSTLPDDFASIPKGWFKAQDLTVDDTQARLYLVCGAADCGHQLDRSKPDTRSATQYRPQVSRIN